MPLRTIPVIYHNETLCCRYLVGCDGAHSIVRHGLGLSFEGDQYPLEFMLGDVEVHWALPPPPFSLRERWDI
jgi:2-polyprenyl-6-methoxyphenol hydroxylase-like FAD-dependent oxidoreductase